MKATIAAILVFLLESGSNGQEVNSLHIRYMNIPVDRSNVGTEGDGEYAHKSPVHRFPLAKPLRIAESDDTCAQHETFDLRHRRLRTKNDFSFDGNEGKSRSYSSEVGQPFKGFGTHATLGYGDGKSWPVLDF
jgi:hypothetical protein